MPNQQWHNNQANERARTAADSLVESIVFLGQQVGEQNQQLAILNENLNNLNIVIAQSSPGGLDTLAGVLGNLVGGMKRK